MKTIVIITEHFYPMNTTAASRPTAWAKHLHEFGYYPIIITPSENEYNEIEVKENYEVIRIACMPTFVSTRRIKHLGCIIGKFFGLIDIFLANKISYNSQRHLAPHLKSIIAERQPIGMLVTAPSFSLFGLAKKISTTTGIKWIADYRDDWTTNEETSRLTKLIYLTERILEKRNLDSAEAFFSVSTHQKNKISNFINKKGYVIANGYNETGSRDNKSEPLKQNNTIIKTRTLNIIYTGTLYPSQRLSFLRKSLELLDENLLPHLCVFFVGTDNHQLNELYKFFEQTVVNINRVTKREADKLLLDCDAALYIAYCDSKGNKLKGIPSSKIYEYIKYKKPVLMMPRDSDIAEKTLNDVGLALSPETPKEAADLLEKLITNKLEGKTIDISVNEIEYRKNSRRESTMLMAKAFNTLLN